MVHSSVRPSSQGSLATPFGFAQVANALIRKTKMPIPIKMAPIVLTKFSVSKFWLGRYVNTRRCIPIRPRKCCTKNVRWKPMIKNQKEILPSVSFSMRPNIFGHQ